MTYDEYIEVKRSERAAFFAEWDSVDRIAQEVQRITLSDDHASTATARVNLLREWLCAHGIDEEIVEQGAMMGILATSRALD